MAKTLPFDANTIAGLRMSSSPTTEQWDGVVKLMNSLRREEKEESRVHDGFTRLDALTEAITKYLGDRDGLHWTPHKGDLAPFLRGVAEKIYSAHVRRDHKCVAFSDYEQATQRWSEKAELADKKTSLSEIAWERTADDPVLRALVEAILEIDDGHDINKQLAKNLGITETEVRNRRRRLYRRLRATG